MNNGASRAARIVVASAVLALPAVSRAAGTTPPKATPAPAFTPVRVRTDVLKATGEGTVEAPFSSFRTTTEAFRAEGVGAVEAPFKPVTIKTERLTAQGAETGGPK